MTSLIRLGFFISSLDNILNRDKVKEDLNIIAEETIDSLGFTEDQVLEDEECSPWLGTGTLAGCVGGTKISSLSFEQQVTNLTVFDNKLYIVFKEGTVYSQKSQDSELELFLDLNEKAERKTTRKYINTINMSIISLRISFFYH